MKYDFSNDPEGGYAAAFSVDFPVTVDDPYVGTNPEPIYNLELIRDFRRKDDAFGINLGYRYRRPGGIPANNAYYFPLKDQVIASFAYVYGIRKPWRIHAEIYGSTVTDKDKHPQQKHASALEGLIGYKHKVMTNFWAHIGATAELMPEGLAPDYRIYAGFNYYFGFGSAKEVDSAPSPKVIEPLPEVYQEKVIEKQSLLGPDQVEVYTGGQVSIPISGGEGTLSHQLDPQMGIYDSVTQMYAAPMRAGETKLIVTDSANTQAIVRVIVKEIPKPEKEFRIHNVNFIFNTENLTLASQKVLEENVNQFVGKSVSKVVIVGHTDSVGKDDYNQRLSLARAETVAKYVRERLGLQSEVEAVGYGESRPIDTNDTEKGRLNNRRVEFKIYYKKN